MTESEYSDQWSESLRIMREQRDRIAELEAQLADANAAAIAVGNVIFGQDERIAKLESERDAAVGALTHARIHTGVDGDPCPLCRWDNGTIVEWCAMHVEIDRLRPDAERWKCVDELAVWAEGRWYLPTFHQREEGELSDVVDSVIDAARAAGGER